MNDSKFNPIITVNNDRLFVEQVGKWAEEKYRLVGSYCDLFTKSMKSKWDNLIYIDLFSGCGYSSIRGTNIYIKSSPLISLSIPNKFTKYIFCEEINEKRLALEKRIIGEFKNSNYVIIEGDANKSVDLIINSLPKYSTNNTVLSFCIVDPYAMSNLNFETVEHLSNYKMDFLILIPTGMDANRNLKYYLHKENRIVDNFLSDINWRDKFLKAYGENDKSFVRFISKIFTEKMLNIGYKIPEAFQEIRSSEKNLPLYHLAFYSKHALGNKFWNEVRRYSHAQKELFE